MDFNRLQRTQPHAPPTHPIKIFEQLPSGRHIPNDLWRGQTTALTEWDSNRSKKDVLVSLNTGAGKTIVGLLIAQSLINEGSQSVLYVCSTNDLVAQTAKEADRLGIRHTVRMQGRYSNDLFQIGQAFCITNYSSVFNARSVILREHFPDAVIFDDAHVAEAMLRDAFTLKVPDNTPGLFSKLKAFFQPAFDEVGRLQAFLEVTEGRPAAPLLVPPAFVAKHTAQLTQLFRESLGISSSIDFAFDYLKDNLEHCAVTVGSFGFEVSPPFLPVRTLPILASSSVRRVYLSATLINHSDFVRAFGKRPDEIIAPDNDAGNGERLVLFSRYLPGGELTDHVVDQLIDKHKVVVAVPSYFAAGRWSDYGSPPSTAEFSDELQAFREADKGIFILVARVDGIDLPQDTCRVMVIDGLPRGANGLERFQWETLGMRNLHATRIANRIGQLFGRINRGRNDYGAFLLHGDDTANWLRNDRNLALLPDLLRQQIKLGVYLHETGGLADDEALLATVEQVMQRQESWLEFYQNEIDTQSVSEAAASDSRMLHEALTNAADSEAVFIYHLWNREYAEARQALESTIEATLRADARVAGWQNVWLGLCNALEGDHVAAHRDFSRARSRLGSFGQTSIYFPTALSSESAPATVVTRLGQALLSVANHDSHERFERELRILRTRLAQLEDGTVNQQEEAIRALGEAIGFTASRPDNDENTGPDVLWVDETDGKCIAIELKTDKNQPARYNKGDVGQGHQHIEWVVERYGHLELLGLVFVGPDGLVTDEASPSDEMYLGSIDSFISLRERLMAVITDLRRVTASERIELAEEIGSQEMFSTEAIFKAIYRLKLVDIKNP